MAIDDRLLGDGAEWIGLGASGHGHPYNQLFLGQPSVLVRFDDNPRQPAIVVAVINVAAVTPALVQDLRVRVEVHLLLPTGLDCENDLQVPVDQKAFNALAQKLAP